MANKKSTGNEFLEILGEIDNEYAAVADDGIAAGDVRGYINTGSCTLNALLSGSIYGGLPSNKVTALAGEPATGKTFFAINIVKQFLIDNPEGFVFYFESEAAISKEMLVDRDVDVKRIAIVPVETVQQFRTEAIKILDNYIKRDIKKPMLFVLDSLGNLSTAKEMEDIASNKDTRDMTRAQLIKGAFRVLTLKLGKANVPLIVTNHVYSVIGSYIPEQRMGGGSGLEYAASTIIYLKKKKDRDKTTKDVTGVIITASTKKSRVSIENKKVETLLDYSKGLDPYYGLLDLSEKFGLVKKVGNKYEFPNGKKEFESAILKNPETFFTDELLVEIDEKCRGEFLYGKTNIIEEQEQEEKETEEV